MKRTPPQTSRGLGGSSNKDEIVTIDMLKKKNQNESSKSKDSKTDSQGKKRRSKKGKNKQKMITDDSSKKVDDSRKLADERLLKEMHLSSSESEVDDKKILETKENQ